jgi:hypothetical protein
VGICVVIFADIKHILNLLELGVVERDRKKEKDMGGIFKERENNF